MKFTSGLSLLLARRTPARVGPPGPASAEVEELLAAAASAPDHGKLRPWRFLVFAGGNRQAFADALAAGVRELGLGEPERRIERDGARVNDTPLIVMAVCSPRLHSPVPVEEQTWAVAAAVQNLLLACTARGYSAMWKTGRVVRSTGFRECMGIASEEKVVACVYIGTAPIALDPPTSRRAAINTKILASGESLPTVHLKDGTKVQTGTVAAMPHNVALYNSGERGQVETELEG
jgi:nitroreductase